MIKYWIFMVCSVIIASVSQIILKKSAGKKHMSLLKEYMNVQVITGYVLLIISTVLIILAFRGIAYKNGPVIESLGYIFVMLLSRLVMKEKITIKKVMGNLLVICGIVIFYI